MEHTSSHPDRVVELDAPLADAVVAALRRRGCPAWTADTDGDRVVLVPPGRREEALRLVGDAMDELSTAPRQVARPVPVDDRGEEPARPLLLPRLRGAGVAILLIPLLVVSLSAISLPRSWAAALVVIGVATVFFLRVRARRDDL